MKAITKQSYDVKNKEDQSSLLDAATKGEVDVIKKAIDKLRATGGKGELLRFKDHLGRDMLSHAAYWGNKAVVELLLETKEFPLDSKDSLGETPLLLALERYGKEHEETAKLLFETAQATKQSVGLESVDSEHKRSALMWAVAYRYKGLTKQLLEVQDESVLGRLLRQKDRWGDSLLSLAADRGVEETVEQLLNASKLAIGETETVNAVMARDASGRTPLSHAVASGNVKVANLLLERLSSVKRKEALQQKDNVGWTLASYAAAEGQADMVELLIKSGMVDMEAKSLGGRSPLWLAAEKGHAKVISVLMSNSLSSSFDEPDGVRGHLTPLMIAAKNAHPEVVKELISRGANIWAKDEWGNRVLRLAELSDVFGERKTEVIRLLKEAEEKSDKKWW